MTDTLSPAIENNDFLRLRSIEEDVLRKSTYKSKEKIHYSNDWDRYPPVERSLWWLQEIKGYPDVGSYNPYRTSKVKKTASSAFKNSGRTKPYGIVNSGQTLLPGAYNSIDFTHLISQRRNTYSFKDSSKPRDEVLTEGLVDKQLKHLTPGHYNVEHYQSIKADPEPVKNSYFRSKSRRVIPQFQPKEGPSPGAYESQISALCTDRAIRSGFQSRAPRFTSSYNKVPAPGMYSKSYQSNMPANMRKLGRHHGLFFSTAFYP